ncbi:hypothetical protein [Paenibacillus amylolyticus]|uniref:hypothetical protein n=1 Tax=Paenibacillus amylolyticus TaxID=1451 RepID=UPI003EC06035
MTSKKWISISVIALILIVAIGVWYANSRPDTFIKEAGGNIYADDYEEKFNEIESKVEVTPKKLTDLVIKSYVDLDQGSLKYELYDPNGALVESEQITQDKSYSKEITVKYTPGIWVAKYYINSKTNGSYNVTLTGQ